MSRVDFTFATLHLGHATTSLLQKLVPITLPITHEDHACHSVTLILIMEDASLRK